MNKPLGKHKDRIIDSENPMEFARIAEIRQANKNKKIVFSSGCYDIVHSGHAIFFEQMREYGDVVVIDLGSDPVLAALKPGRPINPEMNRAYILAAMKDIDYVIIGGDEMEEGKIDFDRIIRELKPDVFVLIETDSSIEIKRKFCETLGIKFVLVKREVPDYLVPTSTTEIVQKLLEKPRP